LLQLPPNQRTIHLFAGLFFSGLASGTGLWQDQTNKIARITEATGALEQAAQGGGGVSFSGDIQDPSGQGPLRSAVGDPASAGGLD